ncbi:IS30 family transposase [Ligilactobacillus murinus]|uniref:IS30 family transposase n=1 Tax=Ligilactobacillus murinus TaxID=1622 RepID=UPI0013BF664C|nr:IS30 family transposase [Ligilactobacillus murinus]NEF95102.1 IS30 family transposase [Ligilactobacillus murinus]
MTYNHLIISELSFIQNFWHQGVKAYIVAKTLKRSAETIYSVFRFSDAGYSISEYYENYRTNKAKSGRKPIVLPNDELEYIKEKISLGWTPDTIIGRNAKHISCSMRTLYRIFKRSKDLDVTLLPMKGKRHPNGYVERRGKAGRLGRALLERHQDYPNYHNEFGHLEADTIQGKNHHGSVMTLVERRSKAVIIFNTRHKTDKAIFEKLDALLSVTPKGLFKSITFDNGKEFSKWKDIANKHDISTYFADVGAPNQRALNEQTNGLLRKDGLGKDMYLSDLPTDYVQQVASYRNNIPRKSLNYKTPLEVFIKYITNEQIVFF